MRTRIFDQMTELEIQDYLKKNDIILLPVGVVEMHGEMPVGCEHVMPLAFADRMAAEVDGLVLSGLVYFFAGATMQGKGTINVKVGVGAAYLKDVFRCLWDSGFRRIVCLTAHGPAFITVNAAIREFFEETHNSVAYVDLNVQFQRVNDNDPNGASFDKLIWGSYYHLGRLDEIKKDMKTLKKAPPPSEVQALQRRGVTFGYSFADISHHGWWPDKPMTEKDRLDRAKEGLAQMDKVMKQIDAKTMLHGLREVQKYHQDRVFKKGQ